MGVCLIRDPGEQLGQLCHALCDDDAELGTVGPQGVGQHRALTDQKIAGPVQHEHALLLGALDWHEAHVRARHCLADRLSICRVVLAPLHGGLDIGRRHQPHLMPKPDELPRPVVRSRAGLDAHEAGWQPREEPDDLRSSQPSTKDDSALLIDTVDLEHVLGEVETNRDNLHGGRRSSLWRLATTTLRHCNAGSGRRPPHQSRSVVTRDVAKLNARLQEELAGRGMAFNRPDVAPFRDKLRKAGFYAEWKGKYGDEAQAILETFTGGLS